MKSLAIVALLIVVAMMGAACGGGSSLFAPDPESTPPAVSLNGATEGASYGDQVAGSNTLNLKAVASDASGIANITIKINGTLVAGANDASVELDWDVTDYDDGQYEIEAEAFDNNGNSAKTTVTVIVDNDLFVIPPLDLFPLFPEFEIIWP